MCLGTRAEKLGRRRRRLCRKGAKIHGVGERETSTFGDGAPPRGLRPARNANRSLPAEEFEYDIATRLGLLKPHPMVRVADDDSLPPFRREQSLQLFVDPFLGSRALLPGQQERRYCDLP